MRTRRPGPQAKALKTPSTDTGTGPLENARWEAFCREYLIDSNGTQACIRVGYAKGGADVQAVRLLGNPKVTRRIAELTAERDARLEVKADDVVRALWDIHTADPNDLIQYRRTCCRYCYGQGHRYQETPSQRDARFRQAELEAKEAKLPFKPQNFDELGGLGWDPRKAPHPECVECFGEGVGDVFVADTRNLKGNAKRLYGGVKLTNNGLEVKMRDQDAALMAVGRHLKVFTDTHEHTGPDGGPIPINAVVDVGKLSLSTLRELASVTIKKED